MPITPEQQIEYDRASQERDSLTNAFLAASEKSTKLLVVAGPGTGKTHLFASLLRKKGGSSLTLSFINALVNDLSLGLAGLSEVKTLHGLSTSILKKQFQIEIFPKLASIIRQDSIILHGKDINFDEIFQRNQRDKKEELDFYLQRKTYYGKYYGFQDVIFSTVEFLKTNRDQLPKYSQILVDEFQDFNIAEVALIDLLAEVNPILIAGDDDQSLYTDLKNADPVHIRDRHHDRRFGYHSLPLKYCSRCTRVIVDSTNDVIIAAQKVGLLKGRVKKAYEYFPSPSKDAESANNPFIIHTHQYQNQIAGFIQRQVAEIADETQKAFTVLVVMPPQFRNNALPQLAESLRRRGFRKVITPPKYEKEPNLLDGLRLLLDDKDSNLGWRVVAEMLLTPDEFGAMLQKSTTTQDPLRSLLSRDLVATTKSLLTTMRKVRDQKAATDDDLNLLFEKIGYVPHKIARERLLGELEDEDPEQTCPRSVREIPITITTIPSSKGLAGDYVFITHFDDRSYLEDPAQGPVDGDVYKFIVALTRGRKRVTLISLNANDPLFLSWLNGRHVRKVT